MMDTDKWMDTLRASSSLARDVVDGHMQYYGDLLHTIMLREMLNKIIKIYDQEGEYFLGTSHDFKTIGDLIAEGLNNGDPDLQNILTLGFLSPYGRVGHRHPILTTQLGKDFSAIVQEYDQIHGLDFDDEDARKEYDG